MKLWCVLHFQNSSVYRSILYSILFYRQQLQIAFGFSTLPPSYPNFIFIFYSNSNSNILDIYRLKDEKLEILITTTNHYDSGEKWNFLYSLKMAMYYIRFTKVFDLYYSASPGGRFWSWRKKKLLMSSERVLIFKNVKFAKSMYGFPIMSSSITKGSTIFWSECNYGQF